MNIISRATTGLKNPKSRTPWKTGMPYGVTAHWIGSDLNKGNLDATRATVRSIQSQHMDRVKSPLVDIAYNFLGDWQGNVLEGRGWDVQSGAHSPGNEEHYAYCFLVDKDEQVTPEQWNSFVVWRQQAIVRKNAKELKSHIEWGGTSCPGTYIIGLIKNLREGKPAMSDKLTEDEFRYMHILAFGGLPGNAYDGRYTGQPLTPALHAWLGTDPLKNPLTLAYKVKHGLLVPAGSSTPTPSLDVEAIAEAVAKKLAERLKE